ncbi:hypothetical protein BCR36DRAFT_350438 [Piromyces finnis]|uniref:F-box domain-containing protein n=1 Tax=Piromyces finnis TaxID=1754191 RepID=A0A1Y1VCG3_9FUNG|nr:hypothetical protein BCR36DRAFT_350438 [Piromyces finnis]|eukprot:ORX52162.1 hypothetical protein BCR36DRAFT_350438 [Piromyces finnis]
MIPQVILPFVFQQLNDKELLKCSLVCKLWYTLTFDPLLSQKWKKVNFQEKVKKLTDRYTKDSISVISRLKNEEKMDWETIYKIVLKRGKNQIQYLKIWSCFNKQCFSMIINSNSLNNLITLDLRGTNFDISILCETYKYDDVKKITYNIEKNDKATEEKETTNDNVKRAINESSKNKENQEDYTLEKSSEYTYCILDYFSHLKYLFFYGCKNISVERIEKINKQWKDIQLDMKICHECNKISKICSDKKLKFDVTDIEKLSHCKICKKEYCDQCLPLWTCESCGGDPTCRDCRAHGLNCTTCNCDYCYTCNQPKKVLQCRYCNSMSCGQSTICQNLGYLYKACDKCDYYVCNKCKDDNENLVVCSGKNCTKSYCKTCINETHNNSLISFDKVEVEKRVRENNFALCSYCNNLYCNMCIDNISFYIGNKDLHYCIVLCKKCETYYKNQLINIFRTSQPNISNNNERNRDSITHTSSYADNLINMSSNILTNNTLLSPVDIYSFDQYIR